METFTDVFKNYKKYSAEALKEASIMQAISSAGMFLAGQKNINDLKVDRPNNLSTDTLSLNSYDMSRGALDNLDKSFNTMLLFSRESGKDANPLLMSEYSRSVTDIAAKQATLNNDIHNKEAIANFEASNKTKAINTQIEANYLGSKDKLDMAKAGMRINNLGQLTKGIANIENMKMAREDALGKMGTEAKYLDKSLGLHNRSVFNGDKFVDTGKIEVPKSSLGELQKGFNINATPNKVEPDKVNKNNVSQSSSDRIFAAGKYQVIPDTLQSAIDNSKISGINGESLFNKDTQEKLEDWLLIHKAGGGAVGKYFNGDGTVYDAATAIAAEWRSVAVDDQMNTFNSNDKVNKATILRDDVISALKDAKKTGDYTKLKNLIATEESNGDYNIYNQGTSNGKIIPMSKNGYDLSKLTINDILRLSKP